jgi:hypothetical protein
MSHPSLPRDDRPSRRSPRKLKLEQIQQLEERKVLAPFVSASPTSVIATAFTTQTPTSNRYSSTIVEGVTNAAFPTAAPYTTVSELTTLSSAFGGDIVRIEAGPGGDFGKGIFAISRGAGSNTAAVNRPGVIYRVDTATGKSSVFFDLNTVIAQQEPGSTAAASVGASTGLVNWYDISFDMEGYFDGRPSMFVSVADRADPNKDAVYRIAPDGTFLGAFTYVTDGATALRLTINPTAVLVPPAEQQNFLRGLFVGTGTGATTSGLDPTYASNFLGKVPGTFSALFFDANQYRPGQSISNASLLPTGVSQSKMNLGPQVALISANALYASPVFSVFTDFGTPGPPNSGIPATVGFSGVQGSNGEFLINRGRIPATLSTAIDTYPYIGTAFRRFQDATFDKFGYFSQGISIAGTATAPTPAANNASSVFIFQNISPTITTTPLYAGNLFVSDLASGLAALGTIPGATGTITTAIVPIQSAQSFAVNSTVDTAGLQYTVGPGVGAADLGLSNLGGRIVRITPDGVVYNFAQNFNTSGALDSTAFSLSSLSITFSADGTTLYASDDDGIWQFKTASSLASSATGGIVGLNDLRTLGVPYDGQDAAIAVIDSGVDANNPNFRGRVATGTNIITNGAGNVDLSTSTGGTVGTGTGGAGAGGAGAGGAGGGAGTGGAGAGGGGAGTGGAGAGGAGGGTGGTQGANLLAPGPAGHGTLVAGVIAQFVPQVTILPVNIFNPFLTISQSSTGGGAGGGAGGTGGGGGAGGAGGSTSRTSNAVTTPQNLYDGLGYVAKRPFVKDPVRPLNQARIIATTMGFGTVQTFDTEMTAYKKYPQIVAALKNQLKKYRSLGIAPIAAAGQFGAPAGASSNTTGGTAGTGTAGTAGTTGSLNATNNSLNPSIGDMNGMSLPAVLNEVISVGGTIPYPYLAGVNSTPNDPESGVLPSTLGPVLLYGNTGALQTTLSGAVASLTNGNTTIYSDKLIAASNRSITTDYVAPAVDVPTFARTSVTSTTSASLTSTNLLLNTVQEGGTSLSAGVATGSYALVQSALSYWDIIRTSDSTVDGYLTTPVGVNQLNFGKKAITNLSAYNNPDGINAILSWTAVPVADANDSTSAGFTYTLFGGLQPRSYARVDVGNAIAAIETKVALDYLIPRGYLEIMDSNKDTLLSAQEVQDFVDTAAKKGMAEAGAMARQLGGNSRSAIGVVNLTSPLYSSPTTPDQPDQPDVLQRRFNFLEYAAHGSLQGVVPISELKNLDHNIMPIPDSAVIVDRQRASANGFLVNPDVKRNFTDLQHTSPKYAWVSKNQVARYKNISPDRFGVNRGQSTLTSSPLFALYDGANRPQTPAARVAAAKVVATTNVTNIQTASVLKVDAPVVKTTVPTADATPTAILAGLTATAQQQMTTKLSAPTPIPGAAAPAGTLAPTSTETPAIPVATTPPAATPTPVATDTTLAETAATKKKAALVAKAPAKKQSFLEKAFGIKI